MMHHCVECGDKVPQKDIDRGFAFLDGETAYCYKCVAKYLLKMEQLRRAADFSEALDALTKHTSHQVEETRKLKQRSRWSLFFIVLLLLALVVLLLFALLMGGGLFSSFFD
ncbi:MAG: hypothetical protein N2234_04515 [Planctomycetota bacterium]|nr:hypothetical protein [Planctomycetota bacterium]